MAPVRSQEHPDRRSLADVTVIGAEGGWRVGACRQQLGIDMMSSCCEVSPLLFLYS